MGLISTFSVSISAHQKGPVRPMVNFGLRFPSRPFPLASSPSVTSLREMARENPAEKALSLLCDPNFAFKTLSHSDDSNYRPLQVEIFSFEFDHRGPQHLHFASGSPRFRKIAVLELVLSDLLQEFPDMISLIRLSGLLHSSDNCAFKEIAGQLCMDHQLVFSRMASFDDNSQFMIAMLRECGLAHKTIIFVLDGFDLFALGKQRLLYSLLDAIQSVTSQAVVIGVSSRLDADMLLDKRAFEHLLQRELIGFADNRGQNQSVEFSPVKLLVSSHELHQGLKSYGSCPAILQQLMDRQK